MIPWILNSDKPIYIQLIEQFKLRLISGFYSSGEKLPAVRDLASEASVNPNTMQKALALLEQDGLVYSQRTSGRYITQDTQIIEALKKSLAVEEITGFLKKMNQLGFQTEEILDMIKKMSEEI